MYLIENTYLMRKEFKKDVYRLRDIYGYTLTYFGILAERNIVLHKLDDNELVTKLNIWTILIDSMEKFELAIIYDVLLPKLGISPYNKFVLLVGRYW